MAQDAMKMYLSSLRHMGEQFPEPKFGLKGDLDTNTHSRITIKQTDLVDLIN